MKTLAIFLSAFLFQGCAHQQLDDTANISELDAKRLLEVHRQLTLIGDRVWPGFAGAQKRLVLVGNEWQWAINTDPHPNYYRPIDTLVELKSFVRSTALASVYYDEIGNKHKTAPQSLYNAYSSEQTGGHFKHPIFFIKTVESLNTSGDATNSEDWVHMSVHELFHNFQDKFIHYTPEFIRDTAVTFKQEIQNDLKHTQMVRAELDELSRAACAKSVLMARQLLKNALRLRKIRWAYITNQYGKDPSAWEQYEVAVEGTARYVEHKVMAQAAEFKKDTYLKGDPYFKGFEKMEENERPKKWCQVIKSPPHKRYWYFLGWAYSLTLDRIRPEWKAEVFSTKKFFDHIFSVEGFVH